MGRLDAQQPVVEPDVEVTERAAPLVGSDDRAPESGIPSDPVHPIFRRFLGGLSRVFEADGVANVVVEALGEVAFEQPRDGRLDQVPVSRQHLVHRLREATPGPGLDQRPR